jgi:DNA-directed RNA polymerase specialized sigma24 family protein
MAAADQDRDRRELRFRELYQANLRPVQGYAVNRLGSADDVPDVVGEVFTIAWRRPADVPPAPADRLWLDGTARRVKARMRTLLAEETGSGPRVAAIRPNGATDGS